MKVQQTFQSIQQQLTGLPATVRLLIGSLMVILVLSLFLVAQLAGRPSMVPLPIDLDPEGRDAALAYMERADIPFEERNGRLLVPLEQKYTVLAQLTDHQVITGAQINFDTLIEQDSPFLTREQNRKRWLIAKMNVLSAMISRIRGIQRATVVIDQPDRIGFGKSHVVPTASVNVVPSGGALTSSQVEAIAHLVAGSHPGLRAADVQVIDAKSGRRHQLRTDDELSGARYLEVKRDAEKHVRATIEDALAYIPGVRVNVNAMVDTRQVVQRSDRYEDPKIGPLSESNRIIDSTQQSLAAEPGIRPNTGVAISRAGTGSRMTDERSDSTLRPVFPKDSTHVQDNKGYALKVNATIGVPRSYFVGKYRQEKGEPEADPDDTALQPTVSDEKEQIRAAVVPLIDTAAFKDAIPGTVIVSMISDFGPTGPALGPAIGTPGTSWALAPSGGGGGGGGGGSDGGGFDVGLFRYAGLVGLVLLSLAMMFLMVRKAGAREELPTAAEIVGGPPPLRTDQGDIVGEAEESTLALEGVEMDDTALRRQQMLDQISEMVKQNPDEVAGLMRRWIRVEA